MKDQATITARYILLSWLIGIGATVVLVMVRGSGAASPLLIALLRPGLLLAERMGYGVYDWHASILMVFGNSVFYGAIVFVIMLLVRHSAETRLL